MLLLHGEAAPADAIPAGMTPIVSLGLRVGLVNKGTIRCPGGYAAATCTVAPGRRRTAIRRPKFRPNSRLKRAVGPLRGVGLMMKGDVTCPECGAGFRRLELTSQPGIKGEYCCPGCWEVLERFDGSTLVVYRLTIQPSVKSIRD